MFSFSLLKSYNVSFLDISNSYWIGLRRIPGTDRFNWSDGTPLLQDSFQTWSGSEPDNLGDSEDCVTMGNPCCNGRFSMYRWSDYSCLAPGQTIKPGFICQKLAGELFLLTFQLEPAAEDKQFIKNDKT